MFIRRHTVAALTLLAALAASGCSSLLTPDPTPEPGAAATLTRSLRTPIPTVLSSGSPGPSASPVASRAAIAASPSPRSSTSSASDAEVDQLQRRVESVFSTARLAGIESLLLDHVALSTAQGGSVLDGNAAASWLRTHAGPTIKVTRVERGTQSLMLQVSTDGWPPLDPIQQGQVGLSLRRYDASGRPNDDGGEWKIDVIDAE